MHPSRRTRRTRGGGSRWSWLATATATAAALPAAVSASLFPFQSLYTRQATTAPLVPQLDPLSVVYSNASAAAVEAQSAQPHLGRFGHSTVYLPPPTNSLLLIGGQLDAAPTTPGALVITQDVLEFRLASTYLWGDDRPVSAIPDNPAVNSVWSTGLPATAWAAAAAAAAAGTDSGETWLIGGVTPDCEQDALVHSLNSSSAAAVPWTATSISPRAPPRRRQASVVAVSNSSTGGTDLWVFGGIADRYTCSVDTIGYVGLDRYDTVIRTVESMHWQAPKGSEAQQWQAPVSDSEAVLLDDGESIVLVGGQTAVGELVLLNEVLVFNVKTREWVQQATSGPIPSPRMGHSALLLPSGSILIYGGLSPTHTGLSDLSILNPKTWTWVPVSISDASMSSPALAWHSANLVAGGTVVVAFGLDGESGTASNRFWFISIDETTDPTAPTYTWKDYWEGYEASVATTTTTSTAANETKIVVGSRPMSKLATRGRLVSRQLQKLVMNPKASEAEAAAAGASTMQQDQDGETASSSSSLAATPVATGSSIPAASSTPPTALTTTTPVAAAAASAPPSSSSASTRTSSTPRYIPPFASEASSSSSGKSVSHSGSATPLSANAAKSNNSSGTSSSTSKGTVVGASIGALGGAIALIGAVAFCLIRRRRNSDSDRGRNGMPTAPMMAYAGPNSCASYDPTTGAPLVSQLLYTRPSQNRNLSLGSTAPAFSPRREIEDDDLDAGRDGHTEGEDMAGVGSRGLGLGVGLGAAQDPFADSNRVNEVGQFEPSANAARSGAQGSTATGLGAALQSSVKSIPFLSSIARTTDSPRQEQYGAHTDSFTQPAPTLAARGSIRRPRPGAQPDAVPTPGTPAELIGMAITSDDGHDALPYLMVSSPSDNSSSVSHEGPAIPSSLRPGTPLRVANPDPFADR